MILVRLIAFFALLGASQGWRLPLTQSTHQRPTLKQQTDCHVGIDRRASLGAFAGMLISTPAWAGEMRGGTLPRCSFLHPRCLTLTYPPPRFHTTLQSSSLPPSSNPPSLPRTLLQPSLRHCADPDELPHVQLPRLRQPRRSEAAGRTLPRLRRFHHLAQRRLREVCRGEKLSRRSAWECVNSVRNDDP